MSKQDAIRAWKDPEYRDSLSEEERNALPEHPSGLFELSDAEMGEVAGAITRATCTTYGKGGVQTKACPGNFTLACCSGSWRGAC